MYPVEVVYQSPDAGVRGARRRLNYVDAAVQAAERIVYESSFGDVLIFMPGERDIRETSDLLEGRLGRDAEVIPVRSPGVPAINNASSPVPAAQDRHRDEHRRNFAHDSRHPLRD